jgi:16S rRNA (cytidine1402-2'-O)-methyltransferase
VVVVEGRGEEKEVSVEDAIKEIGMLMKKGLGRKEAVRRVSETYGLSKKELYDRSLTNQG